ncbi:MAG: DsbA family protein [Pseudomonadales bacterium]|nr:DsbA family protein [Pseudomonadales bacterium]
MKTQTLIRSRLMRVLASRRVQTLRQAVGRARRGIAGHAPTVHYFHEITDPFSHLAVQRLAALADRYAIAFVPHLVTGEAGAWRGDAGRFDPWALADARSVAACYGVEAPGLGGGVEPTGAEGTASLLAPLVDDAADGDPAAVSAFAAAALEAGRAFWAGEAPGGGTSDRADARLAEGNALRRRLGHYLGAMFHFEGEWYWGLDRLYLLEERLQREGYARAGERKLLVPRPRVAIPDDLDASSVTLEYFPSLRSPYTAVGHGAVQALVATSRVTLDVRPVMPMMMRGVPAPRAKQQYIMSDAAREARAAGVPFGRMVDPFGEPVRRALSLWAWVRAEGREMPFLESYLRGAWAEGVDITSDAGLEAVLARAGLDPRAACTHLDDPASVALLDANLEDMLAAGLWGVPSFRVSGGVGHAAPFACWGQDRIWRVAAEIVARAGGDPGVLLPEAVP